MQIFSNAHRNYLVAITKIVEPRYFHEAVKKEKLREAMAKETEALELNKTWTVEELPPQRSSLIVNEYIRLNTMSMDPLSDIKHIL